MNECATNNGGCHRFADCTNIPGNRTCACKAGYQGDGVASCRGEGGILSASGSQRTQDYKAGPAAVGCKV